MIKDQQGFLVPRTGFEPAHPFERCHLKAVRLPISPSGHYYLWRGANIRGIIIPGLIFSFFRAGEQNACYHQQGSGNLHGKNGLI
jgi:hypothetical protein